MQNHVSFFLTNWILLRQNEGIMAIQEVSWIVSSASSSLNWMECLEEKNRQMFLLLALQIVLISWIQHFCGLAGLHFAFQLFNFVAGFDCSPSRFDRMLYLGVSDSHEAQVNILEALTRKFRLDPGLDLRAIAQKCPLNLTGADFYALCSDAMLNAMSRKAEGIDTKICKCRILKV
jgi:SpoVK/Ycf46/Vps4 family AAA+-type ATPase